MLDSDTRDPPMAFMCLSTSASILSCTRRPSGSMWKTPECAWRKKPARINLACDSDCSQYVRCSLLGAPFGVPSSSFTSFSSTCGGGTQMFDSRFRWSSCIYRLCTAVWNVRSCQLQLQASQEHEHTSFLDLLVNGQIHREDGPEAAEPRKGRLNAGRAGHLVAILNVICLPDSLGVAQIHELQSQF